MNIICRLAAATLLGAAIAGPAAGAPPERELVVVNRSQRVINEIYVSTTESDDWGQDRLSDGVMLPGAALRIRLGRIRACAFDVQVVYDDGAREEADAVNLCRTRQLAFAGARAVAAPVLPAPAHAVVLHNQSFRPIQQVFISPPDAQQWGEDLLTEGPIAVGGRSELRYRGPCAADLRVVFDNRAAEERRGLDMCRVPEMSILPGWTTSDRPAAGARASIAP